jgi:predicted nucleic acid-binding protein
MILVDSSVWMQHFKKKEVRLAPLLSENVVVIHPLVIAEIACGTPPKPRAVTLETLRGLEQVREATITEVLRLIDMKGLHGRGCGYVDIALLSSVLITGNVKLWTFDAALKKMAEEFGVSYCPPLH